MHRALFRLLAAHNPFYLLSALCMIAGCFALANALSLKPDHLGKLILLLAVLNAYECLMIGLALVLIVRRGRLRDGRILLLLEAVFLVDATHLNAECFMSDPWVGAVVNLASLALTLCKVGVIVRVLRMDYTPGALAFMALQWAALLGMPGLFAGIAHTGPLATRGTVPAGAIYWAWWIAGLLPVLQAALVRAPEGLPARGGARQPVEPPLRTALAVLPCVSLLAHLLAVNWVYGVPFYVCNVAPLLPALGAACARRAEPGSWIGRVRPALPALAVALSLNFPDALLDTLPALSGGRFSPFRAALGGAGMLYLQGFCLGRGAGCLWATGGCWLSAATGHSLSAIGLNAVETWRTAASWTRGHVPQSDIQWGIAGIAIAFALLGLGAAFSFLTRTPEERENRGRPGG